MSCVDSCLVAIDVIVSIITLRFKPLYDVEAAFHEAVGEISDEGGDISAFPNATALTRWVPSDFN